MLYTDGLVERRDRDPDTGIDVLLAEAQRVQVPLQDLPEALVTACLPDGQEDDVAILVARPTAATDAP